MPRIAKSHTHAGFEDKFHSLPKDIQKIAARKIFLFEENPAHPSLRAHKLKGDLAHFRSFYVTKNYRVLFRFLEGNKVIYYDIGTHDIYK